jgi:hypothetical protein
MIAEIARDTIFELFYGTVDVWCLFLTTCYELEITMVCMLLGFLQDVQWKESCPRKKNSLPRYSAW